MIHIATDCHFSLWQSALFFRFSTLYKTQIFWLDKFLRNPTKEVGMGGDWGQGILSLYWLGEAGESVGHRQVSGLNYSYPLSLSIIPIHHPYQSSLSIIPIHYPYPPWKDPPWKYPPCKYLYSLLYLSTSSSCISMIQGYLSLNVFILLFLTQVITVNVLVLVRVTLATSRPLVTQIRPLGMLFVDVQRAIQVQTALKTSMNANMVRFKTLH